MTALLPFHALQIDGIISVIGDTSSLVAHGNRFRIALLYKRAAFVQVKCSFCSVEWQTSHYPSLAAFGNMHVYLVFVMDCGQETVGYAGGLRHPPRAMLHNCVSHHVGCDATVFRPAFGGGVTAQDSAE